MAWYKCLRHLFLGPIPILAQSEPADQVDILCLALCTGVASNSLDPPEARLWSNQPFLKCVARLHIRASTVAKILKKKSRLLKMVSPLCRLPRLSRSLGHIRRIPIHSGCAQGNHTRTHSCNQFCPRMSWFNGPICSFSVLSQTWFYICSLLVIVRVVVIPVVIIVIVVVMHMVVVAMVGVAVPPVPLVPSISKLNMSPISDRPE